MSRIPPMRRLSPAQASVARILGPLQGGRTPGGCDDCGAYQTVEPIVAGVWRISVHHDDGCPVLAAYENKQAA